MNKERFFEWFWLIIKYSFAAGLLAFLIRGFLLIPMPVQGSSMEDTVSQGDMVLVERLSSVKRFDVVVFNLPDGSTYVKRVIGLPGESVSYKDDQLYINDKKVAEPFLEDNLHSDDESAPYTHDFDFEELMGVKKLGKDSYFVIGDNRRLSKDSRSFGAISEDEILGTAHFVYYPLPHMKFI
ncbi:signal peptidase I [Tetragenococcus halophilus]|uniref:Signal peptidase I n=2 Tax=Tetragenococcus halophilus TaxID=51669 RepID=A0AAN1VRB3_TETHN|nr:signal peptidase I [Tetragenococcus halophilus]AYW50581.1 signal peptidase I [Tetragenococcus halophilus]MCF1684838.1 signal peptidase I [Tetragenococcus halophilus]MCO7026221.1 signal peptidase I [Tetragenococcus halophilus]MCO8289489.1 signal peptidase I [Tetragenococcus halophilus]MCO8291552.1 signal peptidase I [Tetragenococcus halophilus]